jgi:hypothetical protein
MGFLGEEIGFEVYPGESPQRSLESHWTARFVFMRLTEFMKAYQMGAQLHFRPDEMLQHLHRLLEHVRSDRGRAPLVFLIGLFGSYRTIEVNGLSLIVSDRVALAERLADVVSLNEYREYSLARRQLGWVEDASALALNLRQKLRALLRHPRARALLELARQSVSVTSGAPIPTHQAATDLLAGRYLPPALDMGPLITRASSGKS